MKKFFDELLDWIYKKKCYICGHSKESLKICSACYDKLYFNDFKALKIIDGVDVYSAGTYTNELQKMIRGLKYHRQKELAFYLAKFMGDYWQNLNFSGQFQVIPVPLHKNRMKKRGYNHMELIADEFCKITGYKKNLELITRVKDTVAQYKLTYNKRIQNLENAFCVKNENLSNLPILIIDDITTTGATFESMVKELRTSGIENKIICLSVSNPE